MKQTLIFTALPYQRDKSNDNVRLRLTVHVSIRLDPGNPSTLSEFDDIRNWTEHIKGAQYKIRFGGQDVDAQLAVEQIDDQLWNQLMHEGIKVKGYEEEDLTKHRLMSYPSRHISDFVLKNYRKYALATPTRPIPTADFLDTNNLGAISRYRPLSEKEYIKLKETPRRNEVTEAEIFNSLKIDRRILERRLKVNEKTRFIPYNEQSSPATDFLQFRDFHQIERKPLETPPTKIEKPEFEFHDVLSIVSSYPQIQRKLALVLDFEVPYENTLPDSGTLNLIPSGLNWQDETEISCPKISYGISNNGFYVRSEDDSIIDQGFVKVNTPAFNVFQVDADGAALKLNNHVENKIIEDTKLKIVNINLQGSKILKAKKLPEEQPENTELPALRSAGIALARNGLSEVLHMRFQKAKNLSSKLLNKNKLDNTLKIILPDDSDALFADDITQGYRMDVALSSDPDKWFSLHWKKDAYSYVDSNNQSHEIPEIVADEGFIQIAAAEDTDEKNKLFSGEVMFRWEGWSLSVRKPGYAINEDDEDHDKDYVNTVKSVEAKKYELDEDLEFKLNAIPAIVKGTLPKLRFGEEYMIRVRTVDLAGNSRLLEESTPNPSQNQIRSFKYKRFEPITSPIILLGNHLKDGESLEHLVIRSNFDQSTEEYENDHPLSNQIFDESSTRHLLPPKNSQLMAECHGKFDNALGANAQVAKQMYDFIISRESHFEFGANGKDKVYQQNDVEVIYLPDPMGAGVSLFLAEGYEDSHTQDFDTRLFSFFSNNELTGKNTNISIGEDEWHSGKSMRIKLTEGPRAAKWDSGNRILNIAMPKGQRTRIKFSTWWRAKDIEEMSAIWDMLKSENPSNLHELKKIAEEGRHWMISPGRELELVHAVQQPVEAPEIEKIRGDRNYDQTSSHIHTNIQVHGNSTIKLDIQARWKEIIDLPHHVAPEWHDKSGEINDVEVDYYNEIIKRGFFSEDQPKPKKGAPLQVQAISIKNKALLQQFEDTRHRRISYKAIGASRYQDYFDGLIKQDKLPVSRESIPFEDVIIPSSARPHKPEVEYIIPTFEWRKGETANAKRHRRLGGGLRIYLNRPWFSSGENEKLAIVLPGSHSNQSPSKTLAMPGGGLNTNLTHWGVDPIKLSRPGKAFHPSPSQFRLAPHLDTGVAYPSHDSYKVNVAAYPVEFDKERKLWFCDLAIDHGQMYFPFIKLALARYQQHSVRKSGTDVCLSEIVLADFIQLVPERICTINFKKDDLNTKFTITVEGSMSLVGRQYSPSNYIVMSFLHSDMPQPQHMIIDDDTNEKDLKKERVVIHITEKDIKNDRFSIQHDFKLPKAYKKDPFIIIIEEYEKPMASSNSRGTKLAAQPSGENQPRLVYADRLDINTKFKNSYK